MNPDRHERRGSRGPTSGNVQTRKPESGKDAGPAPSRPACKHKRRIEEWTLSYIGCGIYVGNLRAACAEILRDNGITHVLSLLKPGEEPEETLDGFTCKKYDIRDEDGHAKSEFIKIVDSTMTFIEQGTSGKNKILVHCKQGRSRSVMTVIAYLKHKKELTWFQAFCHVAEKRPYIGLHDEFSDYLRDKKEAAVEVDGPENFSFKLDGFSWPIMEAAARENKKHLEILKGTRSDKDMKDSRKDEGVKLAVQKSKRAKPAIPNSDSLSGLYGTW